MITTTFSRSCIYNETHQSSLEVTTHGDFVVAMTTADVGLYHIDTRSLREVTTNIVTLVTPATSTAC